MKAPKPKVREKDELFIGRCLGDDYMISNYPNKTQRHAECCSKLKFKKKKKSEDSKG